MKEFLLDKLPVKVDLESKIVLKQSIKANKALSEFNAMASSIPNRNILINTLALQEAKDSSEIENIITTHDELYQASIDTFQASNIAKEVTGYKEALLKGCDLISTNKLLLINHITEIQSLIEKNNAGIRKQAGTTIKNKQTGSTVYTPPQNYQTLLNLLKNLEEYINQDNDIDPLVNMAVIHYQFESIHPFYDGNGRTGRIINILYLKLKGLLNSPILYLSHFIINNKLDYYRLLQAVRDKNNWEDWILYILGAIEITSLKGSRLVFKMRHLMLEQEKEIKTNLPNIYSKDLLELLFLHPYTKIDFIESGLGVTRQTASKYLKELERIKILTCIRTKNTKYFINVKLFSLLKKGL